MNPSEIIIRHLLYKILKGTLAAPPHRDGLIPQSEIKVADSWKVRKELEEEKTKMIQLLRDRDVICSNELNAVFTDRICEKIAKIIIDEIRFGK